MKEALQKKQLLKFEEIDEEYIVRLVGKVVTVSVETVKLVEELTREVRQEEWLGKEG